MRVLVIGAGGREHAIAWACSRHGHDVALAGALPDDAGPTNFDLVIPGPEAALVAGVADECARRGLACFGPTAELARLESSKGYTRTLVAELGIPSPGFARFDDADEAIAWWRTSGLDVVVKLDGLAAGKGVIVPEGDADTETAIRSLAAQGPIVLEERLHGPECSLLALCDGRTARALPIAQDHKRIGEGDTGPNTGGMGAYAPAPLRPGTGGADDLVAVFVQPVLDHLAAVGTPYVGVLYAGLMLTAEGPRLLEFNCRFGDPEAQAVLPLLASDLAEVALACTQGRLDDVELRIGPGAAVTVVAAAPGYPDAPVTGAPITLPPDVLTAFARASGPESTTTPTEAIIFPAGMSTPSSIGEPPRVTGGRVLAVTGLGPDLAAARAAAYDAMAGVRFEGMQVRRDIAWRSPGATLGSYAAAGVDIAEGNRAVARMKQAVEATHGPAVLRGIGSFGGAFRASELATYDDPVLVASTDGVGTKVELAARLGQVRGIGADIVNHCIDDILVQAARPLFFLDYLAASTLDADLVAEVVAGMAEACEAAGCALLGGETAEMPGVYRGEDYDLVGFIVGAVEKDRIVDGSSITAGDLILGLPSSGLHTNGYSLVRKVFRIASDPAPLHKHYPELGRTLAEELLEPHRCYYHEIRPALHLIKGLAHITGGGFEGNIPRTLPRGLAALIERGTWQVPPIFKLVQELGGVSDAEMYRVFNMGIGMAVICSPEHAPALLSQLPQAVKIGKVIPAKGRKRLIFS